MSTGTETTFCYRTILLAYDGSSDGRRALCEGAELARRCNALRQEEIVEEIEVILLSSESLAGPT